jgi:hypothetical protein
VNAIESLAPAYDVTGGLLAFENGELDREGTIELFQELVTIGLAWQLQGSYGRAAQQLIDAGEVARPAPPVHPLPKLGQLVVHGAPGPNIGPFVGVNYECLIAFRQARRRDRRFHLFIYRAYNACGLVGHEHNGIAVCDIERGQVLCDEIARQKSGYNGPSNEQVETIRRLQASSWAEFREVINISPRARYSI